MVPAIPALPISVAADCKRPDAVLVEIVRPEAGQDCPAVNHSWFSVWRRGETASGDRRRRAQSPAFGGVSG